jgi:hypothetical protein
LTLLKDDVTWFSAFGDIYPTVTVIAGGASFGLDASGDVSTLMGSDAVDTLGPLGPLFTVVARAWFPLDARWESSVGALANGDVSQAVALVPFGPCWAVVTRALAFLNT